MPDRPTPRPLKVKLSCPYPPVNLIGKVEAGKSSVENARIRRITNMSDNVFTGQPEWLPGKARAFFDQRCA
jgi:hypothetical protein